MYLANHFVSGYHRFACHVAAALGSQLIFQLQRAGSGSLEIAHRALHVEGIAKPRVHINDQWQAYSVAQDSYRFRDLTGADQTHVRATKARERQACAGQEGAFKAGLFHQ